MSLSFQATVTNLGQDVAIVSVGGEVDIATAPELRNALGIALANGARDVVVDFSGTSFIDSTTLGILIGTLRRLRPGGGSVSVVSRDPTVARLFEITTLDRVFPMFPDAETALAHLRDQSARDPEATDSAGDAV
jgi:anti-sigma B factor antagonist